MNKYVFTILTLAVVAGLSFSSCHKSGSSQSVVALWTAQRQATDYNNNGIPDANEWVLMSSYGLSLLTMNFKADGTAQEHYVITGSADTTISFNWTISGNNYLTLMVSGAPGVLHIDSLTSNLLVLKDTSGGQATWTSLTK